MAVRRPLILDGSNNLIEMTDAQILEVKNRCRYLYGASPSVTLSRVASGGSLGTITDTRLQAGAYSTNVSAFPSEATTAEPSTVTVNHAKISETVATVTEPADTNSRAFPVFNNSGNIQAMTATDIYDTFIYDAIDTIQGSVGQPGTYYVHTATTLTGYTAVSTSIIYSDTRADTSLYTAGGIPEVLDQPTTITNYYLLAANNIAAPSMSVPIFVRSDGDLQQFTQANFDTQFQDFMRYAAASVVGTRLRYNLNGSGTNQGSGMVNTQLNGSGNYQTFLASIDDYRAQEFPNGTATTVATHYLKLNQT